MYKLFSTTMDKGCNMTTYQSELLNKHLSEAVQECISNASTGEIKNMLEEGRVGTMELLGLVPQKQLKAA